MVDDINDIFDPEAIYPAGGKPERKKGPKTVFEMSKAEQREYFKQKIEDQRTKRFINNLSAKEPNPPPISKILNLFFFFNKFNESMIKFF